MSKLGIQTSGLRSLFNPVSNFLGEVGLFGHHEFMMRTVGSRCGVSVQSLSGRGFSVTAVHVTAEQEARAGAR